MKGRVRVLVNINGEMVEGYLHRFSNQIVYTKEGVYEYLETYYRPCTKKILRYSGWYPIDVHNDYICSSPLPPRKMGGRVKKHMIELT